MKRLLLCWLLKAVVVEVLGIRFDERDTQWDVFVRKDKQVCEIEVDAKSEQLIEIPYMQTVAGVRERVMLERI